MKSRERCRTGQREKWNYYAGPKTSSNLAWNSGRVVSQEAKTLYPDLTQSPEAKLRQEERGFRQSRSLDKAHS